MFMKQVTGTINGILITCYSFVNSGVKLQYRQYTQLPLKYLITFKISKVLFFLCSDKSNNRNRETQNSNLLLSESSALSSPMRFTLL